MDNQKMETLLKEADSLYQKARLDAALTAYQAVLAEDDTIAWAHSRMGAILAQMGDLEGAEKALLRAIELDPKLPQAHSNLGNIYYARGDYEGALRKYKEAVALDSHNPTYHENLHAAYKKLGKLSEAVAALKQAHRLERELGKEEARAKMAAMKQKLSNGPRGCLGTIATCFVISTLLIVMLAAK